MRAILSKDLKDGAALLGLNSRPNLGLGTLVPYIGPATGLESKAQFGFGNLGAVHLPSLDSCPIAGENQGTDQTFLFREPNS